MMKDLLHLSRLANQEAVSAKEKNPFLLLKIQGLQHLSYGSSVYRVSFFFCLTINSKRVFVLMDEITNKNIIKLSMTVSIYMNNPHFT